MDNHGLHNHGRVHHRDLEGVLAGGVHHLRESHDSGIVARIGIESSSEERLVLLGLRSEHVNNLQRSIVERDGNPEATAGQDVERRRGNQVDLEFSSPAK